MATPTTLPGTVAVGDLATASYANSIRGAFRVLQVVSTLYSAQTATSSNAFSDTGLSLSITPQSSTSKVLIIVNQAGCYKEINNTYLQLKLLRNTTSLVTFENYGGFTGNTNTASFGSCSTIYLDSPATTSATTYKTQFASNNNNQQTIVQVAGATSTITLMEISA